MFTSESLMHALLRPRLIRSMSCRARIRRWLAAYALLALAWPSLGPLPWIVQGIVPFAVQTGHRHGAAFAGEEGSHHEHGDPFDIPGSPLHPTDHPCFACQVLANLARCAPLPPAVAVVPVVALCAVPPPIASVPLPREHIAITPPVRAPPSANA